MNRLWLRAAGAGRQGAPAALITAPLEPRKLTVERLVKS